MDNNGSVSPDTANPSWEARLPFFYGWVIVAAAFIGMFIVGAAGFLALGVLVVPMQEELGWGRSQAFLPITVSVLTTAVMAFFIGRYFDWRYGAIAIGSLSVIVIGGRLLFLPFIDDYWVFLLVFGGIGGLASFGTQAMPGVIVPKWFVRKRSQAVALAILGSSSAAFLTPVLISTLSDTYGWRATWAILGVATLVIALPAMLLVRRKPEDVGLLPDGATHPPPGAEPSQATPVEYSMTLSEAMHTKVVYMLMAAIALGSFAWMGVPMSLVSLADDKGISTSTGAIAFSAYGLFSMSARFAWSYIADRTHVRIAMLSACLFGATVTFGTVLWLGHPVVLFTFACLVGFTIGGLIVLQPLIWAAYFGREHLGAITGVVMPISTVGLAAGPLAMAASSDILGAYEPGIIAIGAAWLVSAVIMVYAKPPVAAQVEESPPAPLVSEAS